MRDPAIHDAIVRHGPPALAWEVLRRDPAYRHTYAERGALAAPRIDADFTARWGLHFR